MPPHQDASAQRQHWCPVTCFFHRDNCLFQCPWDPAQKLLRGTQMRTRSVHSLHCFSMLQLDCVTQKLGVLQDKHRILEGCCQIVPSLKHAKVVSDWAGLRPARDRVRLEHDFHQVIERYHLGWYPYLTFPSVVVTNYKHIPLFVQ